MAEKYGVVPKKFTKEWWPYFWMYYKVHTLAAVFALLCAVYTLYECATAPKYDMTVTYTGESSIMQTDEAKLVEFITEHTDDIDENGEGSVYFQQLVIDPDGDPQYNYAMQTKLAVEFQNDCSYIYIFDEPAKEAMLTGESYEGAFAPVDEWLTSEVSEERLVRYGDKVYGVKLDGAKLAEGLSSPEGGLYVALRVQIDDEEKNVKSFENSKAILNALIQ